MRKPTEPQFMPNTGTRRSMVSCRVCSISPSPPRATTISASSGAQPPYMAFRRARAASASSVPLDTNAIRLVANSGTAPLLVHPLYHVRKVWRHKPFG